MKPISWIAAILLTAAPTIAASEEIKILTDPNAVYSPTPASGGAAASSFEFEGDPELVAAIIAAGGSLLIAGVIFSVIQGDDGSVSVTTATSTN